MKKTNVRGRNHMDTKLRDRCRKCNKKLKTGVDPEKSFVSKKTKEVYTRFTGTCLQCTNSYSNYYRWNKCNIKQLTKKIELYNHYLSILTNILNKKQRKQ